MSGRRGLVVALGSCLLGATLLLASSAQPWVRGTVRSPTPSAERPDAYLETTTTYDAGDVGAPVTALGLVSLAAVAALTGSRGRARHALGVVVLLTGSGAAAVALRALADPSRGTAAAVQRAEVLAAPWVALTGAVAVAAAGALTAVRARRWAALGRAYDAPVTSTPDSVDPGDLWETTDDTGVS